MKKQILTGVTLAGALLAFGCGNDRDSFNDVVLAPTVTATTTTTTTTSSTSTSSTSTSSTGTTTTSTTATNTVPANALYIQPGAAPGGNGSSASPYNSISTAAGTAPAGAFLYVLPAANNAAIVENVQLKDGQQLVGKGAPSVINGKQFARVIADNTYPRITGTVTLANGNTVSGFEFVNPTGSAITGDGIVSANLNNIKVTNATGVAVNLVRASGSLSLTDSDIEINAAGSVFDLVDIRTDEFNSQGGPDQAGTETRITPANAAATTDITVTGNTLLGNGTNFSAVAVGQDESNGTQFRPTTRLRNVTVSNNTARYVNFEGFWVQAQDESATVAMNSNTVESSTYGLWFIGQGAAAHNVVTVNDNQIKAGSYALELDTASSTTSSMNRNNLAVNASYAVRPFGQTAPAPITTQDAGVNVYVSAGTASIVDFANNVVAGGSSALDFLLTNDVSTDPVGYIRVLGNTITRFAASTSQTAAFSMNPATGQTQRLAVRDNVAGNTQFLFSGSNSAVTANLSVLRNTFFNYSFTVPANNTVKAELSGTQGSTFFSAAPTGAANVATDNTTPLTINNGGTLGTLNAGEANIPQ